MVEQNNTSMTKLPQIRASKNSLQQNEIDLSEQHKENHTHAKIGQALTQLNFNSLSPNASRNAEINNVSNSRSLSKTRIKWQEQRAMANLNIEN